MVNLDSNNMPPPDADVFAMILFTATLVAHGTSVVFNQDDLANAARVLADGNVEIFTDTTRNTTTVRIKE